MTLKQFLVAVAKAEDIELGGCEKSFWSVQFKLWQDGARGSNIMALTRKLLSVESK